MTIHKIAEGEIFRNPFPADFPQGGFNPRVVELRPGLLLCAYRRSAAMYAEGARTHVLESRDAGATWQERSILPSAARSDPYSYSASNLARTGDRLTISGFRFRRRRSDQTFFNDKTGGLIDIESVFFVSSDEGRTWQGPHVVRPPAGLRFVIYEGIHELANGDWVVAGEHYKAFNDARPYNARVILLLSSDHGRTWRRAVVAAGGGNARRAFWHMRLCRLGDDSLLGLPWSGTRFAKRNLPLHLVRGSADARHWSTPRATPIMGQTNKPLLLADGNLGLAYSFRSPDKPGIYFVLSPDLGRTWSLDNQVNVWDAYGIDSIGVPRTDKYPSSHDNIGFGAPDALQLSNGEIMVSFWAVQRSQFVARWARLKKRA